jgi:hypothetical protein
MLHTLYALLALLGYLLLLARYARKRGDWWHRAAYLALSAAAACLLVACLAEPAQAPGPERRQMDNNVRQLDPPKEAAGRQQGKAEGNQDVAKEPARPEGKGAGKGEPKEAIKELRDAQEPANGKELHDAGGAAHDTKPIESLNQVVAALDEMIKEILSQTAKILGERAARAAEKEVIAVLEALKKGPPAPAARQRAR